MFSAKGEYKANWAEYVVSNTLTLTPKWIKKFGSVVVGNVKGVSDSNGTITIEDNGYSKDVTKIVKGKLDNDSGDTWRNIIVSVTPNEGYELENLYFVKDSASYYRYYVEKDKKLEKEYSTCKTENKYEFAVKAPKDYTVYAEFKHVPYKVTLDMKEGYYEGNNEYVIDALSEDGIYYYKNDWRKYQPVINEDQKKSHEPNAVEYELLGFYALSNGVEVRYFDEDGKVVKGADWTKLLDGVDQTEFEKHFYAKWEKKCGWEKKLGNIEKLEYDKHMISVSADNEAYFSYKTIEGISTDRFRTVELNVSLLNSEYEITKVEYKYEGAWSYDELYPNIENKKTDRYAIANNEDGTVTYQLFVDYHEDVKIKIETKEKEYPVDLAFEKEGMDSKTRRVELSVFDDMNDEDVFKLYNKQYVNTSKEVSDYIDEFKPENRRFLGFFNKENVKVYDNHGNLVSGMTSADINGKTLYAKYEPDYRNLTKSKFDWNGMDRGEITIASTTNGTVTHYDFEDEYSTEHARIYKTYVAEGSADNKMEDGKWREVTLHVTPKAGYYLKSLYFEYKENPFGSTKTEDLLSEVATYGGTEHKAMINKVDYKDGSYDYIYSTYVPYDNTVYAVFAPIPVVYYAPNTNVTIPVQGNKDGTENTVNITAKIDGNNATVNEIKKEEIEQVGTDKDVVINLSEVKGVTGVTLTKSTLETIAKSDAKGLEVKFADGTTAVFDKTTLEAVINQAGGNTVQLVVEENKNAEATLNKAQKIVVEGMNNPVVIDAYFVSNNVRISDFNGGEVKVTVPCDIKGDVVAWFVDNQGEKESIGAKKVADGVELTINHFSHYVIEEVNCDLSGLKIRTNSKYVMKNGKRVAQVYTTILKGKKVIEELKKSGYTVKYEYYVGTKTNKYAKFKTSKNNKVLHTDGKNGQMYYYKTVLKVYDPQGNLVGKTELKNCKYGNRLFNTFGAI